MFVPQLVIDAICREAASKATIAGACDEDAEYVASLVASWLEPVDQAELGYHEVHGPVPKWLRSPGYWPTVILDVRGNDDIVWVVTVEVRHRWLVRITEKALGRLYS